MSKSKKKESTVQSDKHVVNFKDLNFDTLLGLALRHEVREAYLVNEFEGVMVKSFPFIQHIIQVDDGSAQGMGGEPKNYATLAAYKAEIENQLHLQQDRCGYYLEEVQEIITLWLKEKSESIGEYEFDAAQWEELQRLALYLRTLIFNISIGNCDYETVKQPKPDQVEVTNLEGQKTTFSIIELWKDLHEPVSIIKRIAEKAAPLYRKYLELHSVIFPFDVDEYLNEQTEQQEYEQGRIPVDWDEIDERMLQLVKESDYSVSAAAKQVEKEVGGKRSSGTIRNRYGEVYGSS